MDYLIDTHVCIWALGKRNKLLDTVKEILQNSENTLWVSKISLLEIAIKLKIGKLPEFNSTLIEFIQSLYASGFQKLSVKEEHIESYTAFSFDEFHRDPFDRYLIATAYFESMAIITKDEKFEQYKKIVPILW